MRGLYVVDGTGSDDHEQAVVHVVEHLLHLGATAQDDIGGTVLQRQLVQQHGGPGEGHHVLDPPVANVVGAARGLLLDHAASGSRATARTRSANPAKSDV